MVGRLRTKGQVLSILSWTEWLDNTPTPYPFRTQLTCGDLYVYNDNNNNNNNLFPRITLLYYRVGVP